VLGGELLAEGGADGGLRGDQLLQLAGEVAVGAAEGLGPELVVEGDGGDGDQLELVYGGAAEGVALRTVEQAVLGDGAAGGRRLGRGLAWAGGARGD
jgi:hypothetical protein